MVITGTPLGRSRGYILPATILGTALISALAISTYLYAHELIKVVSHSIQTLRSESRLRYAALKQAAEMMPSTGPGIVCRRTTLSANLSYRSTLLCLLCGQRRAETAQIGYEYDQPSAAAAAANVLDYNTIFERETPCHGTLSETGFQAAAGSRSSYSGKTCGDLPNDDTGRIVLRSNLILSRDVALAEPAQPSAASLLAVSGVLDIGSALKLKADTLIIAGGDLRVKTVRNDGERPIRLHMYSATGSITTESIVGQVELHAISRTVPSNDPTLPFLGYQVLGFWG